MNYRHIIIAIGLLLASSWAYAEFKWAIRVKYYNGEYKTYSVKDSVFKIPLSYDTKWACTLESPSKTKVRNQLEIGVTMETRQLNCVNPNSLQEMVLTIQCVSGSSDEKSWQGQISITKLRIKDDINTNKRRDYQITTICESI